MLLYVHCASIIILAGASEKDDEAILTIDYCHRTANTQHSMEKYSSIANKVRCSARYFGSKKLLKISRCVHSIPARHRSIIEEEVCLISVDSFFIQTAIKYLNKFDLIANKPAHNRIENNKLHPHIRQHFFLFRPWTGIY